MIIVRERHEDNVVSFHQAIEIKQEGFKILAKSVGGDWFLIFHFTIRGSDFDNEKDLYNYTYDRARLMATESSTWDGEKVKSRVSELTEEDRNLISKRIKNIL